MSLFDLPRNGVLAVRNAIRSMRRKGLDFVVLSLEGSFPERAARRAPLPFPLSLLRMFPSQVSLEEMQHMVDVIADDPRVRGVIFHIQGLEAGSATLYTLRRMVRDLRESGKRTVACLSEAGTWDYYLGVACDDVIIPPPGNFHLFGLRTESFFLKETLGMAGITADLQSSGEYKTAPDMFRRTSMTEPHREMLEAILDSQFDELVTAIAEGRQLSEGRVRELIDRMPMTSDEAVKVGLTDALLYEDELGSYLSDHEAQSRDRHQSEDEEPQVPLVTWEQASKWLRRPTQWTTRQRIGVVSLEGLIVMGKSRRMPTPLPLPIEAQSGSETINRALRQAETDPRIAAVILYVDSPGGSSLASDLICRQVQRLRQRKPVVALLGAYAASGGYYVSAPASRIVGRPTTMTGSIGVFGGKFVLRELYDMLQVGRQELYRGARANLNSEFRPYNEDEQEKVRQVIAATYKRFKQVVAEGRGMTEEQVETIARGRVWTGAQAVDIGLVDELGDFKAALDMAKQLAELDRDKDYTVVQITPPRQDVLPLPFPSSGETGGSPLLDALQILTRERVWALPPWIVRVRG